LKWFETDVQTVQVGAIFPYCLEEVLVMNKALRGEFKEVKTRESLSAAKGKVGEQSNREKGGRSMYTSATVVAG
jgi:hypothetical protein